MEAGKGSKIMINDISRAFFHAPATREVYVDLPREDVGVGEDGMCARLNFSLYGTRDAAQNWQLHVRNVMKGLGFSVGRSNPCIFYNRALGLRTFIHGDDFVTAGSAEGLKWLKLELLKVFEMTVTAIGGDDGDSKSARMLDSLVEWVEGKGITYDADPRHAQLLIREILGEKNNDKPVVTPGVRETVDKEEDVLKHIQELKKGKPDAEGRANSGVVVFRYRSIAARANFLALDRVDIQYAVKEIAWKMAAPDDADEDKLRRLALYLKGRPRAVTLFPFGDVDLSGDTKVRIFTDIDWAGCRRTRRSTTGGCILWEDRMIKSWSTTQALVALSSGEAELYGTVKASAEGLGVQALLQDLGAKAEIEVLTDASAAMGVLDRRGLGRLRHIHTNFLWVPRKQRQIKEFDTRKPRALITVVIY